MNPKPTPPTRRNCPRPDKQGFPTQALAEDKRETEVTKMKERGWTKHLPTYSYKCSCTFWHWTSKPPGRWSQIASLVRETNAVH